MTKARGLRVRVAFTDEGGTPESLTSAAFPSSGTVQSPSLALRILNHLLVERSADDTTTLTVTTGSGPTFAQDQTISLSLAGTATKDQDYDVNSESLVLPAGGTEVVFTFTVLNDIIREGDESILVTVLHNGVQIGMTQEFTIVNIGLGPPSLTFGVDEASIDEAGGVSTITISTGTGSTFPADETIELTLTGTATSGTDYMISSTSLTLPAGIGNNLASVTATITATQDTLHEGDETVLISASRGGTTFGSQQTVTIADDDTPNWSVSVTAGDIAEAAGSTPVTVSTGSVTFSSDETITLELGGTATRDTDYTLSPDSLTLTLSARENEVSTVITAIQDNINEGNETATVTASHGGINIGTQQTVTIVDDDGPPSLVFEVDTSTIPEAGGTATFTVRTGIGSTFATDQTINVTPGGTATEKLDYQLMPSRTLTLPAGAGTAESSVTATVTAVQDNIQDPGETVIVTARHGSTDIGSPQTVTIEDDDIDEPTNNLPTTSNSSVTTDEDTAHTFSATEFPFNDTDSGAALDSVTIVTLPSATLGALQLNGTVVSANGQVTNAQLVAGNLQFVPVANANGETSFTFTVNDGEDDSADAATMTVNVTAVNDAPTGLPTISGRAWVGDELTASTTDINDADGLANVDFTYQWLRVDADGISNETAISGATAATYTATAG